MNRKSRLATSWERIAPRIDALIDAEILDHGGRERRSLARTIACWCVRLVHADLVQEQRPHLRDWLEKTLTEPYRTLVRLLFQLQQSDGEFADPLSEIASLAKTRVLAAGDPKPTPLDIVNRVHELLLWLETPIDRKRRGAYYTPQAVAQVVMELVHERLVSMTADGLGLWNPDARVVDFAAGTGAFFAAGLSMQQSKRLYFSNWLGVELDEETHIIGQFCLACQHLEAGLEPEPQLMPRLVCENSRGGAFGKDLSPPFNVVVGNPPYRVLENAGVEWVDGLMRGIDPHTEHPRVSYHVHGKQSSANRKHALADDYVRFLRVAQWHIERAGHGAIGLILNHGILENRSFCELRQTLVDFFDEVLFLDLHGNAKRRELTPHGDRDESVFNIEQGTMIAILAKWPNARPKRLQIGHVYGLRDEKIIKIVSRQWEKELADVSPEPPQFYFHCQRRGKNRFTEAYAKAPSLADIFPTHSTAIVTARDSLVVDDDLERLQARIAEVCDLSISDEAIRTRYFPHHQHRTHAPGDTRSWKLDRARRALAEEGLAGVAFVGFWYRPWDWRWLAYSRHLIDWRREKFTPLLLGGKNLSLVARRQSPPGAPCNYFWTTNTIVLDGILRSDNRGTESVFPLYANGAGTNSAPLNLSSAFMDFIQERLAMGADEAFFALVAILHTKAYQTAFQEDLCRDFPRLLLPQDADLASKLAQVGRDIVSAEAMISAAGSLADNYPFVGSDMQIQPGFPKFRNEAIWINTTTRFEGVPSGFWNLEAGAHRPILRWLKQRRQKSLSAMDVAHMRRMLSTAQMLQAATTSLDQLVPSSAEIEAWQSPIC